MNHSKDLVQRAKAEVFKNKEDVEVIAAVEVSDHPSLNTPPKHFILTNSYFWLIYWGADQLKTVFHPANSGTLHASAICAF